MFHRDQRWVYRNWERSNQEVSDGRRPDDNATNTFWRNIWSVPVNHTKDDWICDVERRDEIVPEMEKVIITSSEVSSAACSVPNWKSPGPGCTTSSLNGSLYQAVLEDGSMPQFLTTGVTHLLHRSGSFPEPKSYRPIKCIPTDARHNHPYRCNFCKPGSTVDTTMKTPEH
uniref:SFRICE_030644 n=1 Tax=Spodoptera frugiperda TaxID=7108 RepID=A0A2H1WUA1_SPOFR